MSDEVVGLSEAGPIMAGALSAMAKSRAKAKAKADAAAARESKQLERERLRAQRIQSDLIKKAFVVRGHIRQCLFGSGRPC